MKSLCNFFLPFSLLLLTSPVLSLDNEINSITTDLKESSKEINKWRFEFKNKDFKIATKAFIRFEHGEACQDQREGKEFCEEFHSGEIEVPVEKGDVARYRFNTTENWPLGSAPEFVAGEIGALWIECFPGTPKGHYRVSGLIFNYKPKTRSDELWVLEKKRFRLDIKRIAWSENMLDYMWIEAIVFGEFPTNLKEPWLPKQVQSGQWNEENTKYDEDRTQRNGREKLEL